MSTPFEDATLYTLQGPHVAVTVGAALSGAPEVSYHDAQRHASFAQDQVHLEHTQLGRQVTVTLATTPDLGDTTLTVLLPEVRLRLGESVPITTIALTLVHRSSLAPPLDHGQRDSYTTTTLHGAASAVPS